METLATIQKLFGILAPLAHTIVQAVKDGASDEEIADRVSGQVRILGDELDALRKTQDSLEDYIKNG
jgi:hypothetical protein